MAKIGYIRVSSADQNKDRQLTGIKLDKTFFDEASGKDKDRPGLRDLLSFVREKDVVVVHSMDRLARNLDDLKQIVNEITDKGASIEFINENLTFTGDDNPISLLLLSVLGAIAEFERSLIKERRDEGIRLAKLRGAYKGKQKYLTRATVDDIRTQVDAGITKSRIAKKYGISRATLYRYLNDSTSPRNNAILDSVSKRT